MIYNDKGESRIVENKEEETKAKGFSEKIVLPQVEPRSQEHASGDRGRLDELEDEIYRLKEQLAKNK
jgi:hypothetical protein